MDLTVTIKNTETELQQAEERVVALKKELKRLEFCRNLQGRGIDARLIKFKRCLFLEEDTRLIDLTNDEVEYSMLFNGTPDYFKVFVQDTVYKGKSKYKFYKRGEAFPVNPSHWLLTLADVIYELDVNEFIL